ncbi:MAG: hypothetical protein JNM93_09695 [Bacteriovoracaceae bacterium]|nr:hypothetical protein [Bacteriovoracaceae bacterium]
MKKLLRTITNYFDVLAMVSLFGLAIIAIESNLNSTQKISLKNFAKSETQIHIAKAIVSEEKISRSPAVEAEVIEVKTQQVKAVKKQSIVIAEVAGVVKSADELELLQIEKLYAFKAKELVVINWTAYFEKFSNEQANKEIIADQVQTEQSKPVVVKAPEAQKTYKLSELFTIPKISDLNLGYKAYSVEQVKLEYEHDLKLAAHAKAQALAQLNIQKQEMLRAAEALAARKAIETAAIAKQKEQQVRELAEKKATEERRKNRVRTEIRVQATSSLEKLTTQLDGKTLSIQGVSSPLVAVTTQEVIMQSDEVLSRNRADVVHKVVAAPVKKITMKVVKVAKPVAKAAVVAQTNFKVSDYIYSVAKTLNVNSSEEVLTRAPQVADSKVFTQLVANIVDSTEEVVVGENEKQVEDVQVIDLKDMINDNRAEFQATVAETVETTPAVAEVVTETTPVEPAAEPVNYADYIDNFNDSENTEAEVDTIATYEANYEKEQAAQTAVTEVATELIENNNEVEAGEVISEIVTESESNTELVEPSLGNPAVEEDRLLAKKQQLDGIISQMNQKFEETAPAAAQSPKAEAPLTIVTAKEEASSQVVAAAPALESAETKKTVKVAQSAAVTAAPAAVAPTTPVIAGLSEKEVKNLMHNLGGLDQKQLEQTLKSIQSANKKEADKPKKVAINYVSKKPVKSEIRINVDSIELNKKVAKKQTNYALRFNDDMNEVYSDQGTGNIVVKTKLSTPMAIRAANIVLQGHVPTNLDLILEADSYDLDVPLLETRALERLLDENKLTGRGGILLVQLDGSQVTDDLEIDKKFEAKFYLNEKLKVVDPGSDNYSYLLFIGVEAGNTLLTYKTKDNEIANKVAFLTENEVYFEINEYVRKNKDEFSLVENQILGTEHLELNIAPNEMSLLASDVSPKKKGQNVYYYNNVLYPVGARQYNELRHLGESVFMGRWNDSLVEIPSKAYMQAIYTGFSISNLNNMCLVQINLSKKIIDLKVSGKNTKGEMAIEKKILDNDGQFYDEQSEKSRKVFLVGEPQGVINVKAAYADGSFDYLQSYCSDDTYLIEQL